MRAVAAIALVSLLGVACHHREAENSRRVPESWSHTQGTTAPGARARAAGAASAEVPGTWVLEGPENVGGRVTAIGVDPNDPDRIWVGTAAGGVFLTEDEGATFRPLFDAETALAIGSLAVHPTDSDTIYVGTGEDNGAGYVYDGEGVFKTEDGGESWIHLGLAGTRRIGALAVDPTNGDRVFAAAGGDWYTPGPERGIYRTIDGGQSWERVLFVAPDAGGVDVVIDPVNPSRVFAAVWQRSSEGDHWHTGGPASGIWRSLDGGNTWTELTSGLPTQDMGKIGLALAPTDPGVIYANIINPAGSLQGIYRSADGGNTWEKRNNSAVGDWYGGFGFYFSEIRVDPASADVVFALDVRLLRSGNGGRSVSTQAVGVHWDFHDLVIDPVSRRWLLGTDGGLYLSHDDGHTFTHVTSLPITQLYDLGIDPQNPARRFGGSQDNGTLRTLSGAEGDWTEVLGNDGLQCEVDPGDPSRVYASMQLGALHRSSDGGASFVGATAGIDTSERVQWNAPLVVDSQASGTVYTARQRVYRSVDTMASWVPVSPDLTGTAAPLAEEVPARSRGRDHTQGPIRFAVSALAVSPVDGDVLWAGTDNGHVWVSTDRGGSWTEVSPPDPAGAWVADIEPDPLAAQRAYVALTRYRTGDRSAYVRATDDLGVTWRDLEGDLPGVPVNALHADPDWRGRLFAGTDLGVYVTDNGGASWSLMRGGMPRVVVLDLVRHQSAQKLFAATFGRSLYTFALGQLGPADGDGDGADNNADCAYTDPGAHAAPGEISLAVARVPDTATAVLTWPSLAGSAGAGTVYDVVRGVLTEGPASALSFACGVSAPLVLDDEVLAPGRGVFYLVRGRNACGVGPWQAPVGACP
jgi:photosystem II stability/assembly factor-like uncharacterized protein